MRCLTTEPNDKNNTVYAKTQIDRLHSRSFFGQLVLQFNNGRITKIELQEKMPLPSYKTDRQADEGEQNEHSRYATK